MTEVLEVSGLTRRFGAVVANDGVDLQVRAGQVVGLLGHNGAGKTTLVSQVVGLLRPDAGEIHVGGLDAVADPAAARRQVALQPQAQAPIDGLTPRMAITLAARLRGMDRRDAGAAAVAVAESLGIGRWLDQRALPEGQGLSGGVRRLTGFAMATVAPTPLVILDEPTNDVDPVRRRRLWQLVRDLGDRGAGVLLVTHNVAEAERVVDELVILEDGRVVAAGTPAALRGDRADLRLELTLDPTAGDPDDHRLRPPVPVDRRVVAGRRVLLSLRATDAAAAIGWATAARDARAIEAFALTQTSLEDTYLSLTSESVEQEVAR